MHVLVLGGTGFVGPHVVRELDRLGHEVTIFHRGEREPALPRTVRHVHGAFAELEAHLDGLLALNPQVVVDMVPFTAEDVARIGLFAGSVRRAVVVSSQDVYLAFGRAWGTEAGPYLPTPLTEESPLRRAVIDPAYDKVGVERAAAAVDGLATTIVRLPAVHGPGDEQHRLYGYVRRMDDGRREILLDEAVRAWRWTRGYVEDMGRAIALGAIDPRAAGRVYNVAYEHVLTEPEWVRAIGRVHGWKGDVVCAPSTALPEPMRVAFDAEQDFAVDSGRIRRELGYRELTAFDEALRRTIEWEREHPPPEIELDYGAEDEVLARLR
jgi:nucleoside-diphosphate-sugar epimerase